jgi:hypothetical protein
VWANNEEKATQSSRESCDKRKLAVDEVQRRPEEAKGGNGSKQSEEMDEACWGSGSTGVPPVLLGEGQAGVCWESGGLPVASLQRGVGCGVVIQVLLSIGGVDPGANVGSVGLCARAPSPVISVAGAIPLRISAVTSSSAGTKVVRAGLEPVAANVAYVQGLDGA